MGTHIAFYILDKKDVEQHKIEMQKAKERQPHQFLPRKYFYSNDDNALYTFLKNHVIKSDDADEVTDVFTNEAMSSLLKTLHFLNSQNCKIDYPTTHNKELGDLGYGKRYWQRVNNMHDILRYLTSSVVQNEVVLYRVKHNPY